MPVQIRIPSVSNRKFEAEIVTLPATVSVNATSKNSIVHLITGLFFTGIGLAMFMGTFSDSGIAHPNILVGLILAGVGALYVARFLTTLRNFTTMTFHEEFVEITHRAIFGTESWRTQYHEFKGVRARLQKLKPELGRKSYYIIELVHEDASQTLPLYAERRSEPPRDHLEHYADILDVPIIEE